MLRLLGPGGTSCEGVSRRDVLRVGALATLGGATLAGPMASPVKAATRPGRIKSVILIDLFGGPSHIDMFDLKPSAPVEVRGEFGVIPTSVPGYQICEHLPKLAEWMDRVTLIRTLSHGYNSHNPYAVMTGFTGGIDSRDYFSRPTDYPSMGSVCHYLGLTRPGIPPYIVLPALPGYTQALRRCGPYGGYLGQQYDPLFSTCEPKLDRELDVNKDSYVDSVSNIGDPRLPSVQGEMTIDLLDRRRSLLQQLDAQAVGLDSGRPMIMSHWQKQAFELLLSSSVRNSFQISGESDATRARYGRDIFGSSVLMARRLVEAGVTYITVHTESKTNGHWDTHANNFKMLKNLRLPFVDRAVTALLQDLKDHGLWDSTLVVMMGDMGRTPKVNKNAGRDHWPQCGFCFLAGGGVKSGFILGSTDAQAAYPKDHPVSPGDICATIYHLLGIDYTTMVPDSTNRPHSITHGGVPVDEVLA
ncbi:MAG: Sulfatase [Planctomycetaceae bacterium]|nr:Sulfatase [Planctomycetaceae bacterium]